jgi:hypothetical protein
MSHRKNKFCLHLWGLGVSLLFGSATGSGAHTVKTASDVAATFHLEPSHNPKAGEPSQVWFALTKIGGAVVPLQNCDCQLVVQQNGQPIAQPTLQAINAEQYQGIPGSDVIFPAVGIYTLELNGKAKNGSDFQPFKFSYEVTVQPGKSPNHSPPRPASSAQNATVESIGIMGWIIGGAIGGLVIGGILWQRRG